MLKLTTDKHKASRGLFATAELLVQGSALADLRYGGRFYGILYCS